MISFKEILPIASPNNSDILWRYLSLEKFNDLLSTSTLFFCRVDLFDDSFEGSISYPSDKRIESIKTQLNIPDSAGNIPESSYLHSTLSSRKLYRRFFYANCWHVNTSESVAMWKLYLHEMKGLAIRTTYEQLQLTIPQPSIGKLRGGLVSYLDYESDWIDALGPIDAYFCKRSEYKHECEYRLLYHQIPKEALSERAKQVIEVAAENSFGIRLNPSEINFNYDTFTNFRCPVNLNHLIVEVILPPKAPQQLEDEVLFLMSKTNLKCKLSRSKLDNEPTF